MLKVLIAGIEYNLRESSLTISERILERSTAQFVLMVNTNTFIKSHTKVEIYSNSVLLFSGTINDAKYKDYPNGVTRAYSVSCSDNHYLVDKRVVAKVFTDMTSGQIVEWVVDNILVDEGITYGTIEQGLLLQKKSYNYRYINDVLDDLASINNYIWFVDHYKALHFRPAILGDAVDTVTYEGKVDDSYTVESDRSGYRNVQYIVGGKATTEPKSITKEYDGTWENITLNFDLAEKPKIYVNDAYVGYDNTVLRSDDTSSNKPFLYTINNAVIAYNKDNNIYPLNVGDTVRIDYTGVYSIVATVQNKAEINKLSNLTGTSGRVDNIIADTGVSTLGQIYQNGANQIERYARDSLTVTFSTYEQVNYLVGDTVKAVFPDDNINQNMLVETMEIVDDMGYLRRDITLIYGATRDSYIKFFSKGLGTRVELSADESENEIVITEFDFERTFNITDNPNPMNNIKLSGTLNVNNDVIIGFELYDKCKFMDVYNTSDVLIGRVEYASLLINTDDELTTRFFVNHDILLGNWKTLKIYGGQSATSETGTGLIITEFTNVDIVKTDLDAFIIDITYIKGW